LSLEAQSGWDVAEYEKADNCVGSRAPSSMGRG
jgi:hypothetical protein